MNIAEQFIEEHSGIVIAHGIAGNSSAMCPACTQKIPKGVPWVKARYCDRSGFRAARFHLYCTALDRSIALSPPGSRISYPFEG